MAFAHAGVEYVGRCGDVPEADAEGFEQRDLIIARSGRGRGLR